MWESDTRDGRAARALQQERSDAADQCRSVRAKDLSDDTIISEVAVVLVNCQCKYQTSHQCHHRHLPAIPVGDYEVPQETGSKVLIAGDSPVPPMATI